MHCSILKSSGMNNSKTFLSEYLNQGGMKIWISICWNALKLTIPTTFISEYLHRGGWKFWISVFWNAPEWTIPTTFLSEYLNQGGRKFWISIFWNALELTIPTFFSIRICSTGLLRKDFEFSYSKNLLNQRLQQLFSLNMFPMVWLEKILNLYNLKYSGMKDFYRVFSQSMFTMVE